MGYLGNFVNLITFYIMHHDAGALCLAKECQGTMELLIVKGAIGIVGRWDGERVGENFCCA